MRVLQTAALVFLPACALFAQQPPPAPPPPAQNGGFEKTVNAPNLWAGVDGNGTLAGFTAGLPLLDESGSLVYDRPVPLPVSVAVGDLNGDKLLDLMSSDPLGYIRIYFNSGTPQDPKFTQAELSLPFLALLEGAPPWMPPELSQGGEDSQYFMRWARRRQGVRIGLWDTFAAGKLNLIAGNYFGDIFYLPNEGSPVAPRFSQPASLVKASIPTATDPSHRWGNVFAPLYHDWDGDQRPDLLVGEGSYSANNVHLFLNQGSSASPVFNDAKRQPLALGEGRMQLTPALADANGDGRLDLLVIDNRGNVTAYLRPDNWKFGDSIPPSGFIAKSGGLTPDPNVAFTLGRGIATLATGDLNGDGLFDLVFGRSNGRVSWSVNKGTKDQPKFESPVDLKGDKPDPPTWLHPSGWDINVGLPRGNFLAFAHCVTAQSDPAAKPVEGNNALKFGFTRSVNKIVPTPSIVFPPTAEFDKRADADTDSVFRSSAEDRGIGAPSNFFILRQASKQFPMAFQIGKTYTISFQAKGAKVKEGKINIAWRGFKQLGENRVERGERGAAKVTLNTANGAGRKVFDFTAGANWAPVSNQVKIEFDTKGGDAGKRAAAEILNKEPATSEAIIEVSFELEGPDGFLYIDDLKMVPSAG